MKEDLKTVKSIVDSSLAGCLKVNNVLSVWSNGTKIRRYCGQDKNSTHGDDKYKRMVAILVEVD